MVRRPERCQHAGIAAAGANDEIPPPARSACTLPVRSATIALAVLAAALAAEACAQQAYPAKPVRLVVAFPAGGGIDTVTRLLAPRLGDALGQQMVADNRVGASGNIGTDYVAKSASDGYAVLMAHASNAALFDKLPYDTVRDFRGVSLIGAVPPHPARQPCAAGEDGARAGAACEKPARGDQLLHAGQRHAAASGDRTAQDEYVRAEIAKWEGGESERRAAGLKPEAPHERRGWRR